MKKVDERKITVTELMLNEDQQRYFERIRRYLAIGYYYGASSNTFGKRIPSCIQAGYGNDYARNKSGVILEIDSFKDTNSPFWRKLQGLLPKAIIMLENWLDEHEKATETTDIRELNKIIRLIGDSMGKFIKREEKITHNIEEKREIKVFATLNEERKYWLELAAMGSQRIKAIDVEETKSG